ncbi:NmrA family NAD(P)-binding protein [Umezawaea beigongshangensis]|uniref:NmrA family NAD(P)-binding protein n=1 Tax=Umezawaea beigongshangensis TaxID=2780383 RepID=UPI0027DD81AA|nr:NmrA family NAD(P)-binding protein [Umezawaea beigongshangensis]
MKPQINTLVVGGTGAMGGRVVHRLLAHPANAITVLTRDPASVRAVALLERGGGRVRLVRGDVDDPAALRRAVSGADRVFCNTDFFSTGSALEEHRQGVAVLEAARVAGVDRFVWSSLDAVAALTHGRTVVPHYDAKAAVAAHVHLQRSEEVVRREQDGWYTHHVSILTTAPYFENLSTRLAPTPGRLPDGRQGLVLHAPLGTGRYPMIGLDDIARFADLLFERWQSWGGRDLAVVAEGLTGEQIAGAFERTTGVPTAYVPVPLDVLRDSDPDHGHDFAAMFQFFQERDLTARDRDVSLLRALLPDLTTLEEWLRATGPDPERRILPG